MQIFDFGEADGAYFLAMEYVDGPSLRTLIKLATARREPLPPAVCARLISHACEGLAFAHDFADPETGEALGLIHRDISPDNILLSRQGAVKVVDFGIAKAAGQSHKTQSGVIKGKLAYMPPEQVRARPLDRRVDVYALGVVLYELLTGQQALSSAESDAGLMQAILFESPTPAAQVRPDLPGALLRILDRALAKEREQRYADCHAFQSDLEEFILSEGKPVTAQHVAKLLVRTTSSTGLPAVAMPKPSPAPPSRPPTQVTKVEGSRRPSGDVAAVSPPGLAPRAPIARPASATSEAVTQRVRAQPETGRARRWPWALVGGLLMLSGSGIVLWRGSSAPSSQTPRAPEWPPPASAVSPAPEPTRHDPEAVVPAATEDAGVRTPEALVAAPPEDAGMPPVAEGSPTDEGTTEAVAAAGAPTRIREERCAR